MNGKDIQKMVHFTLYFMEHQKLACVTYRYNQKFDLCKSNLYY